VASPEIEGVERGSDLLGGRLVLDDDVASVAVELEAVDAVDVRQRHADELLLGGTVHGGDVEAADGHAASNATCHDAAG
jgi:hypothetical protein